MTWIQKEAKEISRQSMLCLVEMFAEEARRRICMDPKRVLLLPPDFTRAHSGAGWITEELYTIFSRTSDVHVIPTLGQHVPHTPEINRWMFGSVPEEKIHIHDWRDGSRTVGVIPSTFVRKVSNGKADWPIPVSLNKMLLDGNWDLVLNIGHVVPHEVLGFSSHNKNYFIGLGGKPMICASHMMAACCGIENNLGCLVTPLRACFNKAENEYLSDIPDAYFEVVSGYNDTGELVPTGVYAGDDAETYLAAAVSSSLQNITIVPSIKKVIAVMQGDEFHSTWVANKAIYRTRMAIADGGELLIVAPGLKRFGEREEVDGFIRKYGYRESDKIMKLWHESPPGGEMRDLAHAAAHLIHGSPDGRFTVTYAPGHLSRRDVESVGYAYADLRETLERYDVNKIKYGFNTMPDGETVFFINTPSAGLWSTADKLHNRPGPYAESVY